jgi:hypothetical protein
MKLITGITLLLCLSVGRVAAQPKPLSDSIRLEFPDFESLITFELRQYEKNKELIRNFPAQLSRILNHIQSSLRESDQSKPQQVEVSIDSEDDEEKYVINLHASNDAATKITVSGNAVVELLPPGWTIDMKMKDATIHVYAPDIQQLSQLSHVDLEPVLAHIDKDPETLRQKRFGLIARLIIADGKVRTAKTSHRLPGDMLGLHAGAGAGLLREKLYPEFNTTVSLYLANRYRENFQRFSAHYELKLFTGRSVEGRYLSQPASFVSLSYAVNFAKDRPHWTGIGAGFLMHNRSELFKGKTLKLFLESDIGSSKLNLIPELYLTDDYKEAILGLKLNYKF